VGATKLLYEREYCTALIFPSCYDSFCCHTSMKLRGARSDHVLVKATAHMLAAGTNVAGNVRPLHDTPRLCDASAACLCSSAFFNIAIAVRLQWRLEAGLFHSPFRSCVNVYSSYWTAPMVKMKGCILGPEGSASQVFESSQFAYHTWLLFRNERKMCLRRFVQRQSKG
jgi:hypothetical protein